MSEFEHFLSDLLRRYVPETPEATLRMARRHAVGLLAMFAATGAVAALLVSPTVPMLPEGERHGWALFWGLLGCGAAGMGCVFPLLVSRFHPFRSATEPRIHFNYLTYRSVGAVGLNGAALLINLVGGLMTGSTVPFVYAAAASLAWIVIHFPTRGRFGVAT